MKKILVTGGFGYVGGRIAKYLLAQGHEVCIGSRRTPTDKQVQLYRGATFVTHDKIFDDDYNLGCFTHIIHAAALNEVDCSKFPALAIEVNINETRELSEKAVSQGVEQFIYISTAHVYRSPLAGFINEDTMTEPRHGYGITHKAAEDYVLAAALKGKMKAIILRVSNAIGPPALVDVNRWTLLVNDLCRQAVTCNEMKLNSNGCQYRDFVTLEDVCQIVAALVTDKREVVGIFNVGSGKSLKIIEMVQLIQARHLAVLGKSVPFSLPIGAISTDELPLRFSIEKLEKLGIVPLNDFEKELDEMILFLNANLVPAD